ncbi:hypothetical protein K3495_g1994 [Podosphaera aphanis]|nr:hypothetical protein K3495_g1994 [Podosphaera aphanis]
MNRTIQQNSVRQPLGDATQRLNILQPKPYKKDLVPRIRSGHLKPDHTLISEITNKFSTNNCSTEVSLAKDVSSLRVSALAQNNDAERNRESMLSTASTSPGSKLKSCVGPWKLGKTLGKGSTARVRLARHTFTGQEAAVKIVQKASAQIFQSGSLANFERAELKVHDENNGFRRMPVGIEREVAIMKLIQHPNILKLYDIWENRKEIYLCLEYVDNGELFEHIALKGRLGEEEAIKYFRQILSAVEYCHSFNICHRDLKPENILLTSSGRIKIADFGMAALHQTPDHQLSTSCGSPHYAAPELIMGSNYRGNMVDIWSMGVILYATLSGRLPFDVEGTSKRWLQPLLHKIKKGQYEMPADFSPEVKDLIEKMLRVNPKDRITLGQIWKHPLLARYDYLDDLGRQAYALSPSMKDYSYFVLQKADINMEVFRHLRSMWHTLSEQKLMAALLSEKPNDQKLFYALLIKFRDEQLESYMPNVSYSPSDYHHVKPLDLTKTFSTCHFPRRTIGGNHQRQISRFTVISNAAETMRNDDLFTASCPPKINTGRRCDGVKVMIYRDATSFGKEGFGNRLRTRQILRGSEASSSQSQKSIVKPRIYVSRGSLANSARSRNSLGGIRVPVGKRRGVSFRHLRQKQIDDVGSCLRISAVALRNKPQGNHTELTNNSNLLCLAPTIPNDFVRSKKRDQSTSNQLSAGVKDDQLMKLNEDVRVQSLSLAKDCDEAFNGTRNSKFAENELESENHFLNNMNKFSEIFTIDTRPLPQPPIRSESVRIELVEARKQAMARKRYGKHESTAYLNRLVTHIDKLMQSWSIEGSNTERRATSAPICMENLTPNQEISSIYEIVSDNSPPRAKAGSFFREHKNRIKAKGERATSAPEPCRGNDHLLSRHKSCKKDTIKFVQPESACGITASSSLRKECSWVGSSRPKTRSYDATTSENCSQKAKDTYCVDSKVDTSTPMDRKKLNWFRRASKEDSVSLFERELSETRVSNLATKSLDYKAIKPDLSLPTVKPKKRVSFLLKKIFKRQNSESDMSLEIDFDEIENDSISRNSVIHSKENKSMSDDDEKARRIAPLRNWFAKLFHIKPTAKFICFSILKKKARRETVTLLKEWRCYGIQDIKVDRERNMIFGKVGIRNYLNIKEVKFAAEFMTVIEHGKRSTLSVARWTQEQGAASSFQKVVETVETFLKLRSLLVSDERKKKMMIKTVKSLKY